MSMENVHFEARPNADGGDPGKLAYLHNPDWQGKTFTHGTRVDDRCCPGCLFPDAKPGKWPHVSDSRCGIVAAHASKRQTESLRGDWGISA